MQPRRGRIPLREKQENVISSLERRNALLPDDDPRKAKNAADYARWRAELPPKRDKIRRPVDGKPVGRLEKHVLADVLQALRQDPRVALVERTQSGLFQDNDRYIRVGTPGKLDITLMLIGGRYGEIEVKRPGNNPDERQQRRIDAIRRNGGIAGCATSAEEALALLP